VGETVVTKREKQKRQNKKVRACKRMHKLLPDIQDRIDRQLQYKNITWRKACAAAISIMLQTMIRVGNEKSLQENETYGVTTLLTKHVSVQGNKINFSFVGKAGVKWERSITDSSLAPVIQEMLNSPVENRVFWYEENGEKYPLKSSDVRKWLDSFNLNPKDIRTYTANKMLYELADNPKDIEPALEIVAGHLGHQVNTCKRSYLFSELLQAIEQGENITSPFTVL
jgi:DNA topoisomerase I